MIQEKINDLETKLTEHTKNLAVLESDDRKYLEKLKSFDIELSEESIRAEFERLTKEIDDYKNQIDDITDAIKADMEG